MSAILTDDELVEITGYRQPARQARTFDSWGVPYKRRADGTVRVGRVAFDAAMSAATITGKSTASNGLKWSKRA